MQERLHSKIVEYGDLVALTNRNVNRCHENGVVATGRPESE